MAVNVRRLERITASSGRIRLDELDAPFLFRITLAGMNTHSLDSISMTLEELRDLFDVVGDLITYIDTAQPDAVAS